VLGSHGKERNRAPAASNRWGRREGREKENGGGGSGVRRLMEGKTEEGSGSVRGWVSDVGQHGTDTVALGCSDSGGRCTPRGHSGRGLRTREDSGVSDAGQRG
jgi:hypothetical protein